MKTLEGKVALITGGASGIGRAIGEEMASRGCEVVLADRQASVAEEIAKGIRDRGGRASAVSLDVRDRGAFERVARDVIARSGQIDFLFNNAGIAIGGDVEHYGATDWDDVIDVNLRGVTNGIHAVYPHMIARKSGHIVNTASVAGLVASPGNASYTATKHAVVALSKAMRVEGKLHGIRVSALCPGAIETPILTGGKFGRLNYEGVRREQLRSLWDKARPMAPDVFAKKVVDAVVRNTAIIVVPSWWKAFWYVDRLSPGLSMRIWARVHDGLRRDLERMGAKPRQEPKTDG
ncbi:MAG TPA: SDR family oxidoreductase, partial [Labilithrix sp.]